MTDIRMARAHSLPLSRAKAVAQAAAEELARRFDLKLDWEGDTLNFRRPGAHGRIEVNATQVGVEVHLGLLLRGFRRQIEESIAQRLDELLPPSPAASAGSAPVAPGPSAIADAGGREGDEVAGAAEAPESAGKAEESLGAS